MRMKGSLRRVSVCVCVSARAGRRTEGDGRPGGWGVQECILGVVEGVEDLLLSPG